MAKTANKYGEQSSVASLTAIRISHIKLKRVADAVRGKKVSEVIPALKFSKVRIAGDVRKLILSAVANAENNHGMDIDRLVVAEVDIGKSMVMKRFMPRARGRGAAILKRFSMIRVALREIEN